MANRYLTQFFYTFHKMPVLLDCNFIVDSTNGNGLGIRSLKGPGIAAVYMNTSASPAPGNPNPAAGVILVELQDTYYRYFGGFSGQVSPVSTSSTSTTANAAQVITSLGTATNAQWQAVGFPVGNTPNVGAAFIPTSSALIGGSATVASTVASGIDHIEVVGDPNQTINAPAGTNQILLSCYLNTTLTAPSNNTGIGLSFYMSNSSVTFAGE
jgi:hypothetical protein